MASYTYKGRSNSGAIENGEIEADNASIVAQQLNQKNIIPIEIKEAQVKSSLNVDINIKLFNGVKRIDIILFTRQMYALTKSGVPLIKGMSLLVESTKNETLKKTIKEIIADLQAGRELGKSMSKFPKIFSNIYISMISIGEQTGKLDSAFKRLYNYLQMEDKAIKQIKSAVRYPIIVIFSIFAAISFLMIKVIPTFVTIFDQFDIELPLATIILITASDFMVKWWFIILIAMVITVIAMLQYLRTPKGQLWWGEKKIYIPIFGSIILRATLARFSRAFSMAYGAGVPILQSLSMLAESVDNSYIGGKIIDMRKNIERGDSLSNTAAQANIFTPLVLQMIAVGEETGELDKMIQEVAEFYEVEVEYDVTNIADLIQPIMMVVIGGLVMILALGIFMPMFNLTEIAKG